MATQDDGSARRDAPCLSTTTTLLPSPITTCSLSTPAKTATPHCHLSHPTHVHQSQEGGYVEEEEEEERGARARREVVLSQVTSLLSIHYNCHEWTILLTLGDIHV